MEYVPRNAIMAASKTRPSDPIRQELNGKDPKTEGGRGGRGGTMRRVTASGPLDIMAARLSVPRSGEGARSCRGEKRLEARGKRERRAIMG